jgi:hypothetical protein
MALFYLNVSNVGRRHGPGQLSAHTSYTLRESARQHVIAINMPTNKHALKREVAQYEEWAETNTRKDARLAYKVMHALPVELNRSGQIEATRRFMWSLTMKGRGRAFAAFHDLGTHNPHVHIVFIDRDIETGKSVALLSASKRDRAAKGLEPNSTEWLRQLWELECNGVLAEHGLDVRIDRRSNLERGIAEAKEKHRGWQEECAEVETSVEQVQPVTDQFVGASELVDESELDELSDTPECPPMPVDDPEDDEYGDGFSDEEETMAEAPPARERVGFAVELYNQHLLLQKTQSRLEYIEGQISSALRQLNEAETSAPQYTKAKSEAEKRVHQAKNKLSQYQRANGKLKGFSFLGFKTKTRQHGEEAALQLNSLESILEVAGKDYEYAQGRVQYFESLVAAHTQQRAQAQDDLTRLEKTYGNSKTLEEAEEILTYNIAQSLKDVSADQLTQMVQDGEISEGEYVDALTILNTPSAQLALDEFQRDRGGRDI